MRRTLARLPLKPPKPRLGEGLHQSATSPSTLRIHGGVTAPQAVDGTFQPVAKRQRPNKPGIRPTDPTSVTAWPPQPPMLLTTEQSDDLGTYITRDSLRLEDVGFEQLVNERRQRSDFHPQGEDATPQGSQAIESSQEERCQCHPLHSTLDRPATNRNHAPRPTQISRRVRRLPSRRTLGFRKEGFLDGPPLSTTQETQALDPKPAHQPNGGCPSTGAPPSNHCGQLVLWAQ